jgi:CrcB protein
LSDAASRPRPAAVLAVAVGGMLGASARYAISRAVPPSGHGFPWATFWTNVGGSLALGVLAAAVLERLPRGHLARPFVATGVIGAFTTMSSFAVEADLLVRDGHAAVAAVYVLASTAVGLALAATGWRLGSRRP